jgi:hypothetical protein
MPHWNLAPLVLIGGTAAAAQAEANARRVIERMRRSDERKALHGILEAKKLSK